MSLRIVFPAVIVVLLVGAWCSRKSAPQKFQTPVVGSLPVQNINDTAIVQKTLQLNITEITTTVSYSEFDVPSGHKGTVLLLHGAAFSQSTWKQLGTMHRLLAAGYSPIAVDLPGKKDSTPIDDSERKTWLKKFITAVGIKQPVVISPSASGWYTIPEIVRDSSTFKGWVAVAPMATTSVEKKVWKSISLPVLFIHGEADSAAYDSANIEMPREKHHLFSIGDRVIYKGDDCPEWTPACVAAISGGRYGIEIDGSRIRFQVSVRFLKHAYCQCDETGESVCEPCNSVACSTCVKHHSARSCYVRPIKPPRELTYAKTGHKASRRYSVIKENKADTISPMSTPKLHPSPSLLAQQIKHRRRNSNIKLLMGSAIAVVWVTIMLFVMSTHTLFSNTRSGGVQWSLQSGALADGNTVLTQNTTVAAAQSVCLSMDSCAGFTFLKNNGRSGQQSSEYLIFYKGWGSSKNEDSNWVSYIRETTASKSGENVQLLEHPEVGKVLLTTSHGTIKVSIRSPESGEILCRAGLTRNRAKSIFLRAESVPPKFGIDGFYGPPYALLQGTVTAEKDSVGSSVGLCDFRDFKQNRFYTKPSIKPYSVWSIKTDRSSTQDSLHFFIALAAHPEWEGNFDYLGTVDMFASEETITTIMHQETSSKQWGQTTVQELQQQIPITVRWV